MTAYLLNLFDLACTLHALKGGGAELNPLMGCVPVMIIYKTAVVGFLCLFLSRQTAPMARWGLTGLGVVYAAVCAWHIFNIFLGGMVF